MNTVNDTKVEEFLRALTTAKQSLNRSEQILAVKPANSLADTEDPISNATTFEDTLKYDTPTHSFVTTNSLSSNPSNARGMQSAGSLGALLEAPNGFDLGANNVSLFEGFNGTTSDGTLRHKSVDPPFYSHRTQTTQFDSSGEREGSLEKRMAELREENSRLVDQSRRGQGLVDELKLKVRNGTNKLEQTQADMADELRRKALLDDRVAGMESRLCSHQQDMESQRSRVSELEQQLTERKRRVQRLELDQSAGKEELKSLKRSYETVSRSLEQAVSSQSRLREALSQTREREREGAMLSEERLTQLKSAEGKLFQTQQHLEQSKKLVESKNQRISHFELNLSPSNGLSTENAALKEKVLVLSQQISKFQFEQTNARNQLQRMESLAFRLETPSPSNRSDSIFRSGPSSSNRGDVEKLKIELEGKERQIRLLEDQLTEKRGSSAEHVEQLQQLQRQLNTLRREKDQAKEECENQIRAEIDRLKLSHSDHAREFENQLSTCSEKLKVSKRETETLRNQLAEAKGHGRTLLSQNESLSKQNGALNHKLELIKLDRCQELEALQRGAEQGRQTVRELEVALKKCRGEVERQANQLMSSEQERRDRISALELELKLSRQDLQQIMEAANNRNRDLQTQIQTCSELEERLSRSQAEWDEKLHQKEVLVSDLQSKISEGVSLNSGLRVELEQRERAGREVDREVAELRTQLATTQGENRALEQQAKLVEQIRIELIQSRDRENQLSTELLATKERVAELSAAQNQLRVTLANEERLISDLKSVESDLASQREEGRQWKARAEELQRNVENRSRDLEKKGTQILELDQAFHKLKGDASTRASDLDRHILQAHTEVRVQKERVAELSSEVAELRRHSGTLEEEKRRLLEQAGLQKSTTRDSQDKHTQALQELQKSRRETQEYSHQLKTVKESHKSKESHIDHLTRQLDTANQRIAELDRKYSQSNRASEFSDKRCQSIQEENRKLIGRLENDCERLKHQLELSSKESLAQNQRMQQLHAQEMARHEQEMTSLRVEMRQQTERHNSESRGVSTLKASHSSLTADLSAEKESSQRLRHNLSLKEAEVARIGARLSALERHHAMQTMRQEPLSISRTSSRTSIDTRDYSSDIPSLPSLPNFPALPDPFVSHQASVPRIETHRPRSSYQPASPHAVTYDAWEPQIRRDRTPNRLSPGYSSSLPPGRFQDTPSRQELGEGVNLSLSQLADDLAKAVSHPQPLPFLKNTPKASPNSATQSINHIS